MNDLKTKKIAVSMTVLLSMFVGGAHQAHAQETKPLKPASPQVIDIPPETTEVTLVFSKSKGKPAPTTDGVTYGTCGSAFIYVEDAGTLYARVRFGASSTQGSMLSASYSWTLRKDGPGGAFAGSGSGFALPFNPSWGTAEYREVNPWGVGTYWAQLDALDVTLENGNTCTGLLPTGAGYID